MTENRSGGYSPRVIASNIRRKTDCRRGFHGSNAQIASTGNAHWMGACCKGVLAIIVYGRIGESAPLQRALRELPLHSLSAGSDLCLVMPYWMVRAQDQMSGLDRRALMRK